MTCNNNNVFNILCRLMPERGRLAKAISSKKPLSPAETWQAIKDLYILGLRNVTVAYLPDHEPVEGKCPVSGCKQ
jgi:hypothetical protein